MSFSTLPPTALMVIGSAITEFAASRGLSDRSPEVIEAITRACQSYEDGGTVSEACDLAWGHLRSIALVRD